MASPHLRIAAYCLPLLGGAAVAAYAARGLYAQWPDWPVALACVASYLVAWHFGMPAAVAGVRSLERVPQVAILLTFGPLPAACLNAAAALIFPFTSPSYSQRSLRIAALRAANNMAMVSLMMLAGGLAYLALGGNYPLSNPGPRDLLPLLGMALAMQAVNVVMLALYHAVAGRPLSRNLLDLIDLGDLMFVPVGVLGALIWTQLSPTAFALFVGFVLLFMFSYQGLGALDRAAQRRLRALSERSLSGAQRVDGLADAQALCERMRLALREMAWSDLRPEIAVSVSGGLVQWSGEDASPLLTRADVHLYEAKRGGRDRIVAA